jgi:hypothetical protein
MFDVQSVNWPDDVKFHMRCRGTGCGVRVARCGLQGMSCEVRDSGYGLWVVEAGCRRGI